MTTGDRQTNPSEIDSLLLEAEAAKAANHLSAGLASAQRAWVLLSRDEPAQWLRAGALLAHFH